MMSVGNGDRWHKRGIITIITNSCTASIGGLCSGGLRGRRIGRWIRRGGLRVRLVGSLSIRRSSRGLRLRFRFGLWDVKRLMGGVCFGKGVWGI